MSILDQVFNWRNVPSGLVKQALSQRCFQIRLMGFYPAVKLKKEETIEI